MLFQKKFRSKQVQTTKDLLPETQAPERPTTPSNVSLPLEVQTVATQTIEFEESFDADVSRVLNTTELETLAETLGLPSLPETVR